MLTFHRIGYMGRLGNQMFQFSSTIGIGHKLGFSVKFPIENCTMFENIGPIDPIKNSNLPVKCDLLDCFDIDPSYFIEFDKIGITSYYQEQCFQYDFNTLSISDNSTLIGYFQTEKYFLEYRDLLLSLFKFKLQHLDSATNYINGLRKKNPETRLISLHVRRGDYVMYPDHHPVCSKEYYTSAVESMKSKSDKSKFLIFSDDPEWCREEFKGGEYVISDLANPYVELCAMSLCDHHIIANSSFSWWGAWLNKAENKIIIAPSRWFGHMINHNTSDIYCKNWIKL